MIIHRESVKVIHYAHIRFVATQCSFIMIYDRQYKWTVLFGLRERFESAAGWKMSISFNLPVSTEP